MDDEIRQERNPVHPVILSKAMVRVKICGMTNLDDACHAAKCGADLLGFIFADSPRRVAPEQAREIVAALRAEGLARPIAVGVFVNTPPGDVIGICTDCGLSAAQLHGDESPDQCRLISRAGISVIKSFRIRDRASLDALIHYDAADFVLCDTYDPKQAGGTGRPFDHSLVAGLGNSYRLILAGGLTPENVADAVRIVCPWGVDVSSGVEAAPGRKDPAKVEAFIRNARAK
jgi:phosphoribosylanthranilate isomerase